MRQLYEGYAVRLGAHLCMTLPPFLAERPRKDDWLAVARLRAQAEGEPVAERPPKDAHPLFTEDQEHIF